MEIMTMNTSKVISRPDYKEFFINLLTFNFLRAFTVVLPELLLLKLLAVSLLTIRIGVWSGESEEDDGEDDTEGGCGGAGGETS